YYRFLLSDSELASAREAILHRIPTALILDATRHDFARDPLSRLVEGPANFWASRIAQRADLVLAAESAPDWPNVRRIGPIVRGEGHGERSARRRDTGDRDSAEGARRS